jgi:hypothetical protein
MGTIQYRKVPQFNQKLITGETTHSAWYRYFTQNELGTPPTSETVLTVGASPYSFTAPMKGFIVVSGGTVSKITFSRLTGTAWTTGQTQGCIPVAQNDAVSVTYTVKPTVVFVPL